MRERFGFLKNEDGFTFIEIMIALIITSLLGIVIWQGLARGSSLIEKISMSSSETVKVLQMEESIRTVTSKVIIPFWEDAIKIEEEDDKLSIPYFEAERDKFLSIKIEDDYLLIGSSKNKEEEQNIHLFGPFSEVDFELVYSEDDEIIGIKYMLQHTKKSFDTITIIARFGSNPFWISKHQY